MSRLEEFHRLVVGAHREGRQVVRVTCGCLAFEALLRELDRTSARILCSSGCGAAEMKIEGVVVALSRLLAPAGMSIELEHGSGGGLISMGLAVEEVRLMGEERARLEARAAEIVAAIGGSPGRMVENQMVLVLELLGRYEQLDRDTEHKEKHALEGRVLAAEQVARRSAERAGRLESEARFLRRALVRVLGGDDREKVVVDLVREVAGEESENVLVEALAWLLCQTEIDDHIDELLSKFSDGWFGAKAEKRGEPDGER